MKNIIICSDGTGKTGGVGKDTNVYKIYKALKLDDSSQVAIYDDGIGTSGLKWFRVVAGLFGFGFSRNIVQLYSFLVRHYEPGDNIYLFGYSRGAATVRALADMIDRIGLIRKTSIKVSRKGRIDDIRLFWESYKALRRYKRKGFYSSTISHYKTKHCYSEVPIKMIGVWDTVSALGWPNDSSYLVIWTSKILERITNIIFPNQYFDYQLSDSVENAYQALALDEPRQTFYPLIWDENAQRKPQNIEQVWFVGAHGNVGAGYPRTGLSSIALDWMMTKSSDLGLVFCENKWDQVKSNINPLGKLYDPRSGIGLYYRFKPRHVRDLCEGKLSGNIMIHESVIERMRDLRYAPILPNTYDVVTTNGEILETRKVTDSDIKKMKGKANAYIRWRSRLYHVIMESIAGLLITGWYMSSDRFTVEMGDRTHNFLMTLIPQTFENFANYLIYQNPTLGIFIVAYFVMLLLVRSGLKILSDRMRLKINWKLFLTSS